MEAQTQATQSTTFERFGWITKEEPLSCITDTNLHLNICILEAVSPFFGYYDQEPGAGKPQYLYWVLDKYYPQEKLIRALEYIRRSCNHRLDLAIGQVDIVNESHPVIRMLNLGKYNQITTVQELFEKTGIQPKKGQRKIQNQMGLIQLCKFLHLKPVEEDLFLDIDNSNRGFFVVPAFIDWESFKKLTIEVKYDTSLIFFDAARAAFMENGKMVELVRIYRENLSLEKLKAIRDRYLRLIG